jgi:hypothetical protein
VIGGTRSRRTVHLTVSMQPNRFPIAWFGRDGVFYWKATGAANVDLIFRRRVKGAGLVRMGDLQRSVRSGTGRIRVPRRFAGRHIGRGTFSVGLASGVRPLRCAPGRLVFTVS